MFKNKALLITSGTESFGNAGLRRIELKQTSYCEFYPMAAVRTNVLGGENYCGSLQRDIG